MSEHILSWSASIINAVFVLLAAWGIVGIFKHLRSISKQLCFMDDIQRDDTQELREKIDALRDQLRELEVQTAIIRGTMGPPIQMPYQGAKRGPKPKHMIDHEE